MSLECQQLTTAVNTNRSLYTLLQSTRKNEIIDLKSKLMESKTQLLQYETVQQEKEELENKLQSLTAQMESQQSEIDRHQLTISQHIENEKKKNDDHTRSILSVGEEQRLRYQEKEESMQVRQKIYSLSSLLFGILLLLLLSLY
jgi:hypothetical protein